MEINKDDLLAKIFDLIAAQHDKMDGVTKAADLKAKSEGYIEALYQVESLIINWVDIKTEGNI